MRSRVSLICVLVCFVCLAVAGCGDDDGSEADRQLIGAECAVPEDCDDEDDETPPLDCLTEFGGGYCGRAGCAASDDCPEGSLCADLNGSYYCFLVCNDKGECNRNRTVDNESNCSSNIDPVEGGIEKLCIPPSSGI